MTIVANCLELSVELAAARDKMSEAARLAGATGDCTRKWARPGDRSRAVCSSEQSHPFARRSAPTRTPRSSADGSCHSTRRLELGARRNRRPRPTTSRAESQSHDRASGGTPPPAQSEARCRDAPAETPTGGRARFNSWCDALVDRTGTPAGSRQLCRSSVTLPRRSRSASHASRHGSSPLIS